MATLQIEPGSPSQTGWVPGVSPNPGIMSFRIDPHEFANPTTFFIKRIKLAALDTAHTSFTVRWTTSKTGGHDQRLLRHRQGSGQQDAHRQRQRGGTDRQPVVEHVGPAGRRRVLRLRRAQRRDERRTAPTRSGRSSSTTRRRATRASCSTARRSISASWRRRSRRRRKTRAAVGAQRARRPAMLDGDVRPAVPGRVARLGLRRGALTVSLVNQNYPWIGDYAGSIRISSPDAINSPQFIQANVRIRSDVDAAERRGRHASQWRGRERVDRRDRLGDRRHRRRARDDLPQPVAGEAAPPNGVVRREPDLRRRRRVDRRCPARHRGLQPDDAAQLSRRLGVPRPDQHAAEPGDRHVHAPHARLRPGGAARGARVAGHRGAELDRTSSRSARSTRPGRAKRSAARTTPNFGWVLSRVRRADPPGGGSVFVYIDGVAVGSPGGWTSRSRSDGALPGLSRASAQRSASIRLQHARLQQRPAHDRLGRHRQRGCGGRRRQPILLDLQRRRRADGVGRERDAARGARSRAAAWRKSAGARWQRRSGSARASACRRRLAAGVARDRRRAARVDDRARPRGDSAR